MQREKYKKAMEGAYASKYGRVPKKLEIKNPARPFKVFGRSMEKALEKKIKF